MLYAALRHSRRHGLFAVGYMAVVVAATWPRFPRVVVPQFLEGMRNLGRSKPLIRSSEFEEKILVENGNGNNHGWRPL